MIFFTDWIETEIDKFMLGWSLIGWIFYLIIFNFYFVLYYSCRQISFVYEKYKRILDRYLEKKKKEKKERLAKLESNKGPKKKKVLKKKGKKKYKMVLKKVLKKKPIEESKKEGFDLTKNDNITDP